MKSFPLFSSPQAIGFRYSRLPRSRAGWLVLLALLPVTIAGAAQVSLTWSDNSWDETGFKVERSASGGAFAQIATVGANVAAYIDTTVVPGTPYSYRVYAYNVAGNSAYTNVVTNAPAITTQPVASQSVTFGDNVTISVIATGQTPLTYQWQKGGSNLTDGGIISGATTSTLSLTGVTLGENGSYTVVVSNGVTPAATSSASGLIVGATAPTITTQPTASQSVTWGATVTFIAVATGVPAPTYQWQKGGTPLSDGGVISGATTGTLTLTGVTTADNGTYTVVAGNTVLPNATSNNSVLTVNPVSVIITTPPPATSSVTWGSTVVLTATATGTPTPTYQWQKDGANLTDGAGVSGSTTSTLTLTSVTGTSTGTYTLVVDNSVTPTAMSNTVLSVNGVPVSILIQPASQSVETGDSVSFSVGATGTPAATYQWYRGGAPITGATGSTYNITTAQTSDAGNYTVIASNLVGSVTSTTATLTVTLTPLPSISTQPVGLTAPAGRSVSFKITSAYAESFQWQTSSDEGTTWAALTNDATYSGVTTNTLTIANTPISFNGNRYRVIATNRTGTTTSSSVELGVSAPVFPSPIDIAITGTGQLLVSDSAQNIIQSVDSDGVANLFAGVPNLQGSTNGVGSLAFFRQPQGIVLDPTGNLYVADTGNSLIRKITPNSTVTTVAGSSSNQGYQDGNGTAAWFNAPSGIAIDNSGNLYVTDTGNSVIRKIDPSGTVTTVAGTAGMRGSVDGTGATARFNQPTGITVDAAGNIFVADTLNQTIRRITPAGAVTIWAGLSGVTGAADGNALTAALFSNPLGVTVDGSGNVYVSDTGNSTIRVINSSGIVSTIAGLPTVSGLKDGMGMDAWFNQPTGLRLDGGGNLYVADSGNSAIRRISLTGVVATLANTQGSSPVTVQTAPTPATPTPTPPPAPIPSGGGGGGAPSLWFLLAVMIAGALRWTTYRRR